METNSPTLTLTAYGMQIKSLDAFVGKAGVVMIAAKLQWGQIKKPALLATTQ
jgi:hypothetical protein